jgi:hypothetical protein
MSLSLSIRPTDTGVSIELMGIIRVCKHCRMPILRDFFGWSHPENGGFSWCNMSDDSEAKAEPAVAA